MRLIKDNLQKVFKNQLIAGSTILFAGNMLASFGNYLYHFLMGRMLGPADYGILASLISLAYLFNIPVGALSLVVVKYVSALRGKREFGAISYFYTWLNKKLLTLSLLGFFLLIAISPWLTSFLHLDSVLLVVLVIASSLIGIYLTVNTATLQGFLRFGAMSLLGAIQALAKLGVAIFLVYLGLKVLGAVLGVLVSILIGCLLTMLFVVRLLQEQKTKETVIEVREIIEYSVPVFFSMLAFTSLYTTDIVLARHFLPAQEAGFYAALATLGKIIFFASNPIIMVLFPMVSERHANGKRYTSLLHLSFGLVLLVCLGISGIYLLFPELMVKVLFGHQYLLAAPHLMLFAVFLSLYSLSFLLVNFYLSVKKTRVVILPIVAAAGQIILVAFLHQNLSQIVGISIGVSSLLLIGLLVYYFLNYVRTQKTPAFSYRSRL